MNNFCKNPTQRIKNENIRKKIKKIIDQVDIDDNITIMNMITIISLIQSIQAQFILLETLRIDTSSKIESSLIKLYCIDEKEVQ